MVRPAAEGEDTAGSAADHAAGGGACPLTGEGGDAWRINVAEEVSRAMERSGGDRGSCHLRPTRRGGLSAAPCSRQGQRRPHSDELRPLAPARVRDCSLTAVVVKASRLVALVGGPTTFPENVGE